MREVVDRKTGVAGAAGGRRDTAIPGFLPALRTVASVASAIAVLVGCLVLAGWALDIGTLKRVLSGSNSMNPTTAITFVLAGASLLLLRERVDRGSRRIGRGLACVVALVGLLGLTQVAAGWEPGIDHLLFREELEAEGAATGLADRMSPNTALNFLLLGCALLLLDWWTRHGRWPAQYLVLVVVSASLLAVAGHAFGAGYLYGPSAQMAPHTALSFVALSIGLLCARPDRGLTAVTISDGAGGVVARRLLPAAILVPVALGWLSLVGRRARLYDTGFEEALSVTLDAIVLTVLVGWSATLLYKTDAGRRRAEEELQRSRDQLEARVEERTAELTEANFALEESLKELADIKFALDESAIVAMTGRRGRITYVNDKFCEISKYSREELIDHRIIDPGYHPEGEDPWRTMARGGVWRGELRDRAKDGSIYWVDTTIVPFLDERGEPYRYVAIRHDITTRKLAEEELRESQRVLSTLMSNLPGMAYRCRNDPDWTMQFISEGCLELTGYPSGDLIGNRRRSYGDLIHAEDGDRVWDDVQAALGERRPFQFTYRIETASGAERWVWEQGRGVFSPEGELLALEGFITDTTERERAEEELRRAHAELEARVEERTAELAEANKDLEGQIAERKQAEERLKKFATELERSNRELEDFASVASHDLQEPLRKVQAFGDRLKAQCGEELDAGGRDYLERMQGAAGRMQTLIEDLLAFARVTTRARPFVPVDLSQVARVVVSDLEARLEQTGGRVEVGELPAIDADPTQIRQLLQNLIGNALKFHEEDEAPVVKVRSRRLDDGAEAPPDRPEDRELCRITVEDNGIGFDEKYLDRIFTVFRRLHGRDDYEGTGVGLAICRKIVERHGGSITATSTPGRGSTFIITLPLEQPGEEPDGR